ncbi:MAG: NUDIX domain-containing protein [Ornithinimicrobium sp.]|uniref:(deoxy)nucleoside triphosphate pyrophosphohydrolase n=1 Tax=Ornithinimicrobium sp. TaxID=1977084 RepID=UPI0026E0D0AD|nr:NUDIX domain-containing protein [Ornithinimicrobium sp.]MDO5739085.1 NUDIX domain-containing protein [Ornithinimicrobium sp.]
MESTSRVIVAAVAIVDDLDRPSRFLAARRTEPPALAGCWEFPGGKAEVGETSREAAVREVREELGMSVRLGARIGGDWPLGDTHTLHLYWAVALPGEPAPRPLEDHDDLRWLTGSDVDDIPWLANDLPMVAHLARLLHTPG